MFEGAPRLLVFEDDLKHRPGEVLQNITQFLTGERMSDSVMACLQENYFGKKPSEKWTGFPYEWLGKNVVEYYGQGYEKLKENLKDKM